MRNGEDDAERWQIVNRESLGHNIVKLDYGDRSY